MTEASLGCAGYVYLAGPMSHIPKFNFPAFMKRAELLREVGYRVFNPAEEDIRRCGYDPSEVVPDGDPKKLADRDPGFLNRALLDDFTFICTKATHMCFLPGWEKSNGAKAEHAIAVALGLKMIYIN